VANRLLEILPPDDQQALLNECDLLPMEARDILLDVDEPIDYVYFPVSGVVSQVVLLSDGSLVEATTIGKDGFVGLSAFLGREISPARFIVQVPGETLRMSRVKLADFVEEMPRLRTVLSRYTDFLFALASQSAACNRRHGVTARCARWLLRIHDLVDEDVFPLTQEFLAQMLGVRRASVTVAAGLLQEKGYIRYAYGRVTILDKEGLENSACECIGATRHRYASVFAPLMG
jgi:CRP-like cAMP-binding protein